MATKTPYYTPDINSAEAYSKQSQQDLLESARRVEVASKTAAEKADFFAPERGRYITGLRELMSGGRTSVASDPSYGFRYEQGQKSLESSLSAQGLLSSGRAGLELQKYGQELASTEFQNQYQRLLELSGVGKSDPTAAADIMYKGANAPFNASQSIASLVFESAQADKERVSRMAMLRLNHEYELDRMRYEAKLQQSGRSGRSGSGGGDYVSDGGGGEGGGEDPSDRYKREYDEWQKRNSKTSDNSGNARPTLQPKQKPGSPRTGITPSPVAASGGYKPMAFAGVSVKRYESFKKQNPSRYKSK